MATTVKKQIETLRAVYAAIGEAIQVIKDQEKNSKLLDRAEKILQQQEQRIGDLEVIVKGYSALTGRKVSVCPECLGAGAYTIGTEVEECDKCDTNGWIEI